MFHNVIISTFAAKIVQNWKQLVLELLLLSLSHHSCWTKGLAMASIPSAGQIRTTEVPLHTTNPRVLVSSVSLYGSSGSGKKKDLEDRIWSNKFQKSWSLIRLCGSSGSDKMWKLVINKIPEFIDSLLVYMDQKRRTEILFNKSQNLLLLCPFTFLVWIWLWGHKT